MIITTTDIIQGTEIQSYLGIVTAEVVYGTNALRDFFAGIRDIIGGRTGSYEEVFVSFFRHRYWFFPQADIDSINLNHNYCLDGMLLKSNATVKKHRKGKSYVIRQ